MDETPRHRSGGRAGRQAARAQRQVERLPFLTRKLAPYELLDEEGLSLLEENADTILQEVGLEFRGDPEAIRLLRDAGADVQGERVRFERGMCRRIVQATAPRQFTQHARNPANSVEIGGPHTVFAPNYGSPFVRDLDNGRRYGTIEDFRNFVKLAYLSPHLHHSGGTVCEPVDVPVNKRHLDMVYSHIRYSDKPFMGSVTAPERAADTVEMARLLFGAEFVDARTVVISLINANSPLVWDATMLGALRTYAAANQATIVTPFILAGAMAPVTIAGALVEQNAEALFGLALTQLVRPGAPCMYGGFTSNVDMKSGAPAFGTPEYMKAAIIGGQLARRYNVPYRTSSTNAANAVDAQAGYETVFSLWGAIMGGGNFIIHTAGWMEGGLVASFEKFALDVELLQTVTEFLKPVSGDVGGDCWPLISDRRDHQQWTLAGRPDAAQAANRLWKQALAEYELPPLDPAIAEELDAFVARRIAEGGEPTDF